MRKSWLKKGTKQLKRGWIKRKPPRHKHKVPSKTKLRNKCDKLVGALCRSLGYCEICGKIEYLQWCHFITRAIIKLRYEPKNYACLCAGCHRKGHNNPEWIRNKWNEIKGEGTTKWLDRESNNLFTITVDFYQNIIEKYKEKTT